jgi:hypothetical protein
MELLADERLWAHPIAVLALPAFIPAVFLVGLVFWIARRDRLAEQAELDEAARGELEASDPTDEDSPGEA